MWQATRADGTASAKIPELSVLLHATPDYLVALQKISVMAAATDIYHKHVSHCSVSAPRVSTPPPAPFPAREQRSHVNGYVRLKAFATIQYSIAIVRDSAAHATNLDFSSAVFFLSAVCRSTPWATHSYKHSFKMQISTHSSALLRCSSGAADPVTPAVCASPLLPAL